MFNVFVVVASVVYVISALVISCCRYCCYSMLLLLFPFPLSGSMLLLFHVVGIVVIACCYCCFRFLYLDRCSCYFMLLLVLLYNSVNVYSIISCCY